MTRVEVFFEPVRQRERERERECVSLLIGDAFNDVHDVHVGHRRDRNVATPAQRRLPVPSFTEFFVVVVVVGWISVPNLRKRKTR